MNRYPASKKPLTEENINELDDLFYRLNRMSRDDKDFYPIVDRIEDITGLRVG